MKHGTRTAGYFALVILGAMPVSAATTTFTFEATGPGGNMEYGSHDPQGFSELVRDGFLVDVVPSGGIHGALHFHELDSLSNAKVPGRPFADRGVLWRDGLAGQDPLVFTPVAPGSLFTLEGLVVGASTADGSQTTGVQVTALLGGAPVASLTLATPPNGYAAYSGGDLGALVSVTMDRMEVVGISTSSISYYLLDDVVLEVEEDRDGDGVPDSNDDCPDSVLEPTVVIGGCDSGVPNGLLDDGCTISDYILVCSDEASSHGELVRCVAGVARTLRAEGVLEGREVGAVQSCAAR